MKRRHNSHPKGYSNSKEFETAGEQSWVCQDRTFTFLETLHPICSVSWQKSWDSEAGQQEHNLLHVTGADPLGSGWALHPTPAPARKESPAGKYLGITADARLSVSQQRARVLNKASHVLGYIMMRETVIPFYWVGCWEEAGGGPKSCPQLSEGHLLRCQKQTPASGARRQKQGVKATDCGLGDTGWISGNQNSVGRQCGTGTGYQGKLESLHPLCFSQFSNTKPHLMVVVVLLWVRGWTK